MPIVTAPTTSSLFFLPGAAVFDTDAQFFPVGFGDKREAYDFFGSMWTAFANLKHNTSRAIDGDALASAAKAPSCHALSHLATSATATTPSPRATCFSFAHSHQDPFVVVYDLWSFDNRGNATVCTVTNHTVNIDLSLWTPLLTEEVYYQACNDVMAAAVTTARMVPCALLQCLLPPQLGIRHTRP